MSRIQVLVPCAFTHASCKCMQHTANPELANKSYFMLMEHFLKKCALEYYARIQLLNKKAVDFSYELFTHL